MRLGVRCAKSEAFRIQLVVRALKVRHSAGCSCAKNEASSWLFVR